MSDLCFVTTCMGRLQQLKQTLGSLAAQSLASTVVVDYSCPDRCGDWVENKYPEVKVLRVEGKRHFNLAHARNVGAKIAASKWLCFIDADVSVAPNFCKRVIPQLKPGHYYRAAPISGILCGTVICDAESYSSSGGYDEVLQGWGGDDLDFYARLRMLNVRPDGFPAELLSAIAHPNDLRVKNYDVKNTQLSWTINQIYIQAKSDIMKMLGHPLSQPRRQAIYEKITKFVKNAAKTAGVYTVELEVRTKETSVHDKIKTCLVYTLESKELVKINRNR